MIDENVLLGDFSFYMKSADELQLYVADIDTSSVDRDKYFAVDMKRNYFFVLGEDGHTLKVGRNANTVKTDPDAQFKCTNELMLGLKQGHGRKHIGVINCKVGGVL